LLQLLDNGANLYHISNKRASGGTPLHEAVIHKHSTMVDLLLQYRADPFLENLSGKTALDLAVESGQVAMVRKFELMAIFTGYINVKVRGKQGDSLSCVWEVEATLVGLRRFLDGSMEKAKMLQAHQMGLQCKFAPDKLCACPLQKSSQSARTIWYALFL
jgi:hypothetical protein